MLPRAIEIFKSQDYPNRELLILMDTEGYTKDTDNEARVYQWGLQNASIATKRNHLCEYAKGEIIVTQDDDDWFASDWVSRTVIHMLDTECDTTGLSKAWFYKPHSQAWEYRWNGRCAYTVGGTMAYKRTIWEQNKFRETKDGFGEDTLFMQKAGRVIPHDYHDGFVAMIHDNNSTSHNGVKTNPRFHPHHPDFMRKVLGADYHKYPVI